MKIEEMLVLADSIKTLYPKDNMLATKESVTLWYEFLKDLPYSALSRGLKVYVTTNKFPPTIADLREKATEVLEGKINNWGAAWEEARKAIHKFGYNQENEALETLSPLTKETVKSLGYQDMCKSEDITTIRANFRMIYENLQKREQENRQMPEKLRPITEQIGTTEVKLIEIDPESLKEKPKKDYTGLTIENIFDYFDGGKDG